jgi:Skp family chaperone for outer membrane proteins
MTTGGRVLATEDAKTAATQLVQLSGQLKDEIQKVIAQGNKLADQNQWDGKLAAAWRTDWQNDQKQLQTSSQQLDTLQKRAQQAVQAILTAGGG